MRSAARHLMTAALMTVAVVGASASSKADTFTQTFTIPSPITPGQRVFGTSFAQFDPARGTLNSIDVSIQGSASGGVATVFTPDQVSVLESFGPGSLMSYSGSQASAQLESDGNFLVGGRSTYDVPFFVGTGNAFLGLDVEGPNGAVVTVSPNSTITYNYTAAAPVAAPGPIAGAGIPALLALGGAFWARRRKALAA